MKKHAIAIVAAAAVVLLSAAGYGDQVIDPLDDNSNTVWEGVTGDATAYSYVTDIPAGLTGNSAQIELPNGYSSWWAALQGQYNTPVDLSAETHIRFWAKAATATGVNPTVRLIFITDNFGVGASHATADITDTWQQYEIPIANFVPDPYYSSSTGDNTTPVDWSNVGSFQYAIGYSALDATPNTFWIDHIEAVGAAGISIAATNPVQGSALTSLPSISVTFNKSVSGVDAADLTVNGSPASNVSGSGTGPYIFTGYAQPAVGTVNVALASGGITDGTDTFAGDNWTYELEEWMLAIAPFAISPVTLDGTLDPAEWTDANSYYFDGTDNTTRPGWALDGELPADDWSCTFSVKHDADYIYVGVYIYDDVLIADGPDTPDWRDDRMEMYFDPDNSDSSNITNSPGGFQMTYDGRNYAGGAGYQQWWWAAATSDTVHVTTYEFQVAKDVSSTVTMVTGGTYGFDMSPCDQDDTTTDAVRDNQVWWNAQTGSAWNNEPPWGEIFLDPNPLTFPLPDQVQNLQGVGADQYALLSWDPLQFATEYRVYQGDATGGPYTMVTTSTATTDVRVSNLVNGSTYFFVVTAANPTGEGAQSAELELLITGESLRARSWQEYR